MDKYIAANHFADILGVSRATLARWEERGLYVPVKVENGQKLLEVEKLLDVPEIRAMYESKWDEELQTKPARDYS